MFGRVELVELSRKAAGADALLASDTELCDGVLALEEVRRLVDAAEAHVLAELDARDVCDSEFGLSTAAWLAREAMLPTGVAKKRVGVANKLRSVLPEVDEALVDGKISWEHARVLADACLPRIEDELAAIQAALVDLAQGTVFDRWKREVAGIV